MEEREAQVIKSINDAEKIINYDRETVLSILADYDILASIERGTLPEKVLYDNEKVYEVILRPIVYNMYFIIKRGELYKSNRERFSNLEKLDRSNEEMEDFFKKYARKLHDNGVDFVNTEVDLGNDNMRSVLSNMSIVQDNVNSEEDIDDIDFDNIEIEEELEDDDIDIEEDIDIDSDDIEIEDEDINVEDNNSGKEQGAGDELSEVWGEKLESVIDGIMSSYQRLYESGYGLVSPCGVLTNVGAVKSTTDGRLVQAGNSAVDIEIYRAICDVMPKSFSLYADVNSEPNIVDIEKYNEPLIYAGSHVKFMFGHLRFCKGLKESLSSYFSKNNIQTEKTTRATKYSQIAGWIREEVEEFFYQAYRDKGVTCEISERNTQLTNEINEKMSRSLKNVIILAERKKGVNTRVRICSDEAIDVDKLCKVVADKLNVGTSRGIKVKQIGEYKDGVLDINVIYNDKKYSQDALFAYQVLDILEEQGIKPSWDNVILGKKDDGTIMTYNFKDKTNAVYALYASSRSGKGVMSLNLVASALADSCKLLYIDGKPDMGNVLTDVAWKDGLDVAVYNGVAGKGSEMLENRGNCIRKEDPFMSKNDIPEGIFVTEQEKKRYMLITTYLKGIQLICDLAAKRASNANTMSTNDWLVAFVDECEQAAVSEIEVMKCLERAESNRKAAKDENGKKIDLTKDKAYKFIQDYKAWVSIVTSNFKICITSTFGFANMTTFFVWQSTKFPEKYKSASSLATVVDSASGSIVKIVGRGAAVNYGSSVYGTPSSLKDCTWYDDRFSGKNGGYFAIGKNVQSNSMKVFRPFNVYSDANNKELILENAKAVGLSENDLKGVSLNRDGTVIKEIGFEGYANRLLAMQGLTVSQQLNIGYKYIDEQVKQLGLGSSLNEFMYNTVSFVGSKEADDERGNTGVTNGFDMEQLDHEQESESNEDKTSDSFEGFSGVDIDSYEEGDIETNYANNRNVVDEERHETNNKRRVNEFNNAYKDVRRAKRENEGYMPEIETKYGNIEITESNGECIIKDDFGLDVIEVKTVPHVDLSNDEVSKLNKFTSKLMETRYGANYQFKQRWKLVLDSISKMFPNNGMIGRVSIFEDGMVVNDHIVNMDSLLNDGYGIYLEDIVNFRALFNRFNRTRELQLDSVSFNWLVREYGVAINNLYKVFAENMSLQVIIVNTNDGNRPTVIERNNLNKEVAKVQRMADEAELRHQMDQVSATYDRKFDSKGEGYKHRIGEGEFGFTKSNWGRAKRNLSKHGAGGKVKGILWIGAAAITGVAGGLFLGTKEIVKSFKG